MRFLPYQVSLGNKISNPLNIDLVYSPSAGDSNSLNTNFKKELSEKNCCFWFNLTQYSNYLPVLLESEHWNFREKNTKLTDLNNVFRLYLQNICFDI